MIKHTFFRFCLKHIPIITIFGMFVIYTSKSDTNTQFSLSSGYDDNPFLFQDSTSSGTFSANLQTVYYPDSSLFGVSYNFSAIGFSDYLDRSYLYHSLDLSYDIYLSEDGSYYLSPVISVSNRIDSDELNYYDYLSIFPEILFGWENSFADIKLSYKPAFISYLNNSDLTNLTHYLNLNTYKGFNTKTSVYLNFMAAYKEYTNIGEQYYITDIQSPNGTPHNGKMKYKQTKSGWNDSSPGNMNNSSVTPGFIATDNNSSIIGFNLNIAQNVLQKTGLSFGINYHKVLNDKGMYIIPGTQDLYGEEQIYNDIFSYDNKLFNFTLSQLFSKNIKASIDVFYSERNFLYKLNEIYDTEIDDYRNDYYSGLKINISKYFNFEDYSIDNLTVNLNYSYINNNSNASLFNYKNNFVSISFSTLF